RPNCDMWSGGRSCRCGEGALPMEWGATLAPPCGGGNALAGRGSASPQFLQPPQAGAVAFGRDLQVPGDIGKSAVVHQPLERQRPDLPLADMLVPVHPATQRLHRIVQMELPQ